MSAVLWTCTAGRFTWRYSIDESIYFLDGDVTITAPGEPPRRFGAGDFVHFSRGAVATWVVESHIRKVAYCRRAPPRQVSLLMREARGFLKRLIRGRSAEVGAPVLLEG